MMLDSSFWKGRRILVTGHTGFKGAWLVLMLERLGAEVFGISLPAKDSPNLYELLAPTSSAIPFEMDIRDFQGLSAVVNRIRPEIVIHMAAQALVIDSYADPVKTIDTNVMGTVNLLQSLRSVDGLKGVLVITSDKVYENREAGIDFDESNALGGHDPYSASKAAAEIVVSAYSRSFFSESNIPVVTARAGNVIGGGDWSANRLIPDLWRAHTSQSPVVMRNPKSTRPWQHVIEPLYGYLLYIQYVASVSHPFPKALNFGPARDAAKTVLELAQHFSRALGAVDLWAFDAASTAVHESTFLSINSTLAQNVLGWKSVLGAEEAVEWTCNWYKEFESSSDMRGFSNLQLERYAAKVGDASLATLR